MTISSVRRRVGRLMTALELAGAAVLMLPGTSQAAATLPCDIYGSACHGGADQVWRQQANGSLINPQSGLCLDDPAGNTTNGTQLQIATCNGTASQQFKLS